MPRDYDCDRFERLALYVASRSVNDTRFGKTKLAKILFFSDFIAYRDLGDSITGAEYAKFPQGPFPRVLDSVIARIQRSGTGALTPADYFGFEQKRLVAIEPVDISRFSPEEISLVDQLIDLFREDNAAGVSALSHQTPAWKYVDDMEPIPYELAWVSSEPPSEAALEIGQEVAARLGLVHAS